jgi:hypothetical protein
MGGTDYAPGAIVGLELRGDMVVLLREFPAESSPRDQIEIVDAADGVDPVPLSRSWA